MPYSARTTARHLPVLIVCATLAGCSPLSFGRAVPVPAPGPAVVDSTPTRAPWVAPVATAAERSDEAGTARLLRLAEVWTAVRWFNPEAVHRIGEWDSAYLRHVEAARSATDDAAYARAVQDMLGELRDVETRVVGDTSGAHRSEAVAATLQRTGDSLIIARPVQLSNERVAALGEQLGSAVTTVVPRWAAVLDLRADSGDVSGARWWSRSLRDDEIPLPGGVLQAPSRRRLRHAHPGGDASFDPAPVPSAVQRDCCTEWLTTSGAVLRAAHTGPDARSDSTVSDLAIVRPVAASRDGFVPPLIVVLVNDATLVPAALFTLHAAGQAVFVSAGSGVLRSDMHALHLAIGGGFHARIRTEELRLANGNVVPTRADTVLTSGGAPGSLVPDSTERIVQLALAIARGSVRVGTRPSVAPVHAPLRTGPANIADAPYPSLPERLLAVTRLWGTVRAFNPYLPMADESWDDMFERSLGEMEVAASARDYSASLMRFVATLDASQADIRVPDHPEFGARAGSVPFTLRLVDRRALVDAMGVAGVSVGDEIVAIGGEPIDKRLVRLRDLIAASNEWSRDQRLESWLAAGPAESIATFRVRARNGVITDREVRYGEGPRFDRQPPPLPRLIESMVGGIVFLRLGADTARLSTPLPSTVRDAAALIVDARGLRDSASLRWLAGSVLDADRRAYARDDRNVITAPPRGALRTPELDPARQFTRTERITPAAPRDAFTGPMAILVDATTTGDGELIVLRLLAGGSNRVLVGTQTAGAVGETAVLSLPGGVRVRIPVSDVRYPDGRFIQRLGLSPSITVAPSVEGVRNARDEVMEAALRWINQQLAPPPARRR